MTIMTLIIILGLIGILSIMIGILTKKHNTEWTIFSRILVIGGGVILLIVICVLIYFLFVINVLLHASIDNFINQFATITGV